MAIIRIVRITLCAHQPSAPAGNCHTYLIAKLILLARLPFGDALHFRLMNTVDLVLVVALLRVDAMSYGE